MQMTQVLKLLNMLPPRDEVVAEYARRVLHRFADPALVQMCAPCCLLTNSRSVP